jgi:DNA-binding NarL/FixJ family response regulator
MKNKYFVFQFVLSPDKSIRQECPRFSAAMPERLSYLALRNYQFVVSSKTDLPAIPISQNIKNKPMTQTDKSIRILIVDDHQMVREGIRFMLESHEKKYKFLVEEASDGAEGVEKAKNTHFDVIIMDYQLPIMNGVEATRAILTHKPNLKILALSTYDEYMYIDNMMRSGAKGFVLKNIGPEEIISAIETIMSGKNYYSNDVAVKLISFEEEGVPMVKTVKTRQSLTEVLSNRELEVLKLIATEHTNEEISNRLFLSKRTVDTHRQNLMRKLGVKNTAGLVKYAVELNIL